MPRYVFLLSAYGSCCCTQFRYAVFLTVITFNVRTLRCSALALMQTFRDCGTICQVSAQ